MTRRPTLSGALLALGVALLVAPALVPLQPVLYHDTGPGTWDNESRLEEQGYEIVAYENLSDRGQELYVRTLRNGGEYRVPTGAGAEDFAYPTNAELGEVRSYPERNALRHVVVERPPDADLPPADEPVQAAEDLHRRGDDGDPTSDRTVAERRRRIARYDVVATRTAKPPLTALPSLLRLLAAGGGVVAIGTGGYLRATP